MTQSQTLPVMPKRVMGLYDKPFWDHVQQRSMCLQRCGHCQAFQYPPGPVCSACLSEDLNWTKVSGRATILSWVIFHRKYLEGYPAPYNVITVRLEEGPIMVSNLDGAHPEGSWIGTKVDLHYAEMAEGLLLPRFKLSAKQ